MADKQRPKPRRAPGRPAGPQREAVRYILGAVLARSGVREKDLRSGFDGGSDTLARNVTGLIAADWLRAREATYQADRTLTLGPQAGHLVGIGVGREMVRCGIYHPDGRVVAYTTVSRVIFPIDAKEALDPSAFGELLRDALLECRRQLKAPIYPLACGVAWPTRVARSTGEPDPLLIRAGWSNISVRGIVGQALQEASLDVPMRIVNDADAEALAETRLGVAQDARSVLVIKLAGGVGAAVVYNGEVLSGARGFAGEIGHVHVAVSNVDDRLKVLPRLPPIVVPLNPDLPCTCHMTGHLQTMVSVAAIVERLAPGLAGTLGSYSAAMKELEQTVPAKVTDLVMHETGVVLGRALCGPVAMLDPDIVVLRSQFFPSSRLSDGVLEELKAASLDVPVVKLGTDGERGRWMGAQGAALVVSDDYARVRIEHAQEDWRAVEPLQPVDPLAPN